MTAMPTPASTSPSSAATRYQTRRGRRSFAGMLAGGGGGPPYGGPHGYGFCIATRAHRTATAGEYDEEARTTEVVRASPQVRDLQVRRPSSKRNLLVDLGDLAGAHGAATLTDGELQALFHGDGLDELHLHLGVVTRHDHLGALGEGHDAGHVRRTEVELRTVVVEERRVAATLVLGEDVGLGLELGVWGDRARLDDDLAALDVLALDATEEQTDVLTGLALVEQLAEHLDAGDRGGGLLGLDADDVDGLVDLQDTTLDTAGDDRTATGDREDVLDRHQERLVDVTLGLRDVLVDRSEERRVGKECSARGRAI